MKDDIVHLANFLENLLVNGGKLASRIITQLSSTTTLISQYFSGVFFLIKY